MKRSNVETIVIRSLQSLREYILSEQRLGENGKYTRPNCRFRSRLPLPDYLRANLLVNENTPRRFEGLLGTLKIRMPFRVSRRAKKSIFSCAYTHVRGSRSLDRTRGNRTNSHELHRCFILESHSLSHGGHALAEVTFRRKVGRETRSGPIRAFDRSRRSSRRRSISITRVHARIVHVSVER